MFYTISREVKILGKYYNQYTDYYADLIPGDSISLIYPPLDWKWKHPRHNNNVIYLAPDLVINSIISRVNRSDLNQIRNLLKYISDKLSDEFSFNINIKMADEIIKSTSYEMNYSKKNSMSLIRLCNLFKIKYVIILGATYSWNYYLIKELKKNGIVTADLQHGWISNVNDVYNYSSNIVMDEEVLSGTPDHFLSYGSWWLDKTNLPFAKKIVLGNPYRAWYKHRSAKKSTNEITIVGCNGDTEMYIKLAIELARKYKGEYNIVFRPHPSEINKIRHCTFSDNELISFDTCRSVHELFSVTDVIISEISTLLLRQ